MARKKREQICGIYKIENLINGKVYIGQSKDIYTRWSKHIQTAKRINNDREKYPLYRAMKKYGIDNFSFEIIYRCEEWELNEWEIYFIEIYKSYMGREDCNGYNQTIGGDSNRGYTIPKEKLRTCKKVICEDKIFNSIKECANYYDESYNSMRNWLSGSSCIPDVYVEKGLKFLDDKYNNVIRKPKSELIHKNKYSKTIIYNGKEYETPVQLSKETNIEAPTITAWLKGQNRMPKEMHDKGLRYKDENKTYKIQEELVLTGRPVICDGVEYISIVDFENKNNLGRNVASMWLRKKNTMPQEFIDKGLRFKDDITTDYSDNSRDLVTRHVLYKGIEYVSIKKLCEAYPKFEEEKIRKRLYCKRLTLDLYNDKLMYADDDFSQYRIVKENDIECNGAKYDSIVQLAKAIGESPSAVRLWVSRKSIPYGRENLHIFINGEELKHSKVRRKARVICEGVTYDSISKCADFYKADRTHMSEWLNGKRKMPQKFMDKGLKYID